MAKAIWNGAVLAETDTFEKVEGNIYFPQDSINQEYFIHSDTHTTFYWKGEASYYDIQVDEKLNKDAAWYYPNPKAKAENIKDYIAFWKGVEITK